MVGIVLVCHSESLAASVVDLIRQMVPEGVPIATAGGVEDTHNPFGTDATKIQTAVEAVFSDSGVLLLMDMGSALLSADTALELLGEKRARRIRLCAAPFVEGALSAAVKAAAEGTLEECAAEAEASLAPKKAQLGNAETGAPITHPIAETDPVEARVVVPNPLGLHARPAARFVQTASRFSAQISISNLTRPGGQVSALSLNGLATLGFGQGHEMQIQAVGEEAEQAVSDLVKLVESGFGETVAAAGPSTHGSPVPESLPSDLGVVQGEGHMAGLPVSPGIALGGAVLLERRLPKTPSGPSRGYAEEQARLETALQTVRNRMAAMRDGFRATVGVEGTTIVQALIVSLTDPALMQEAQSILRRTSVTAETAWSKAVEKYVRLYEKLEDPYMKARSRDLADILNQVLLELVGGGEIEMELSEPGIVLAEDLSPTELIRLAPNKVLGIGLAGGGDLSHTAILARSLSIPAVARLGTAVLNLAAGTSVALDGGTGAFWIDPPNLQELRETRDRWLQEREEKRVRARQPAQTRDGRHVSVLANIQQAGEAATASQWGAEGIGLLRTELIYLDRAQPPEEEEQMGLYRAAAEAVPGRDVVVRTLDLGGDKVPSFMQRKAEANPFLGIRGSRLYPEIPDIIRTQLRAILRAGSAHSLKIMFPMVTTLPEFRFLRNLVVDVEEELAGQGLPHDSNPAVGVMIEVPAAALQAEYLAREADFFSIGTNDLCQYVFAADRTNIALAELADPLHPALLQLIDTTTKAAQAAGIPVAVCGEMAAIPFAVPLLVGLGVQELSVSLPAIPRVKETLALVSAKNAHEFAVEALSLDSAEAVQALVRSRYPALAPGENNQ